MRERRRAGIFSIGGGLNGVRHEQNRRYCGITDGPFHVDHIVPRVKGGPDTLDNLVVACASCNLSKGSKSVAEWLGVEE